MKVEYKKVVKVDELAHLVPTKAGATFSQLWQIFYYTRMFKYVQKRQYPKIKKSFDKICTHEKLQELCQLGYLMSPQRDVYCAKDKVLPILKEVGFPIDLLPVEPKGAGDNNELNNTEVFIQLSKLPHFYILLYPQFGNPVYLIPDALLVQLDTDNSKCKLTFIEVERKKPEWEQYIEKKKQNYLKLSKDLEFFLKWQSYCEKLGFSKADISKTFFTYKIIQNEKIA